MEKLHISKRGRLGLGFVLSVFLLLPVGGWGGLPLLPLSPEKPVQEKPARFPTSLATWNLQWFPGNQPTPTDPERKNHEREASRIVQALDVDLLLFQEIVDSEALGRITRGYPWKVVSNFHRAGDEDAALPVQNLAVVSRTPIQESWEVEFHSLPVTPDRPVRGFLGVRLGTRKNGMTIYTVHLKSNRGGREASGRRRERAIEYLRKDWADRGLNPEKDAILVAGDFNCSLRNPEFSGETTLMSFLQQGWRSATERIPWPEAATVRPDLKGKYPASDFDHILLSPGWIKKNGGESWKVGVLQEAEVPSDHYPVFIRWK